PPIFATCSGPVGAVVCTSGVCDADNSCGYANGTGNCSGNAPYCRSGVCDSADSKCGYADGDGSCDSTSAATVCPPSHSSSTGACEPAGGCLVDADCTNAQFCNTPTLTCLPKLSNGTAIPNVPNHTPTLNGNCTTAAGSAVCSSGVCDTNNKCGYANGSGSC